jgi:hypothetical protein
MARDWEGSEVGGQWLLPHQFNRVRDYSSFGQPEGQLIGSCKVHVEVSMVHNPDFLVCHHAFKRSQRSFEAMRNLPRIKTECKNLYRFVPRYRPPTKSLAIALQYLTIHLAILAIQNLKGI